MTTMDQSSSLSTEIASASICIESKSIQSVETASEFFRKEFIHNFSPSYFVGFLGTGITANILYNFPYPAKWLKICGIIMFCITMVIFITTNIMFILNAWAHPKRLRRYHTDLNESVFIAVYSMGFTTIVNAIHLLVHERHIYLVWVLWWIAVVIAVYNATFIFFFTFLSKFTSHKLEQFTATMLMPIVCPCVVSSSGHLIAANLTNTNHRVITEIASLILFFVSLVLFHGIGAILMARFVLCKIPKTGQIFTMFIPIGFVGQSSYNMMLFANNMYSFIPDKQLGQSFWVPCALFALCLLAGGYIYTFIAIASTLSKIKPFATKRDSALTSKTFGLIKWNKGFWTITFPIGTMSLANSEVSKATALGINLKFFKVLSCIYAICLFVICIINMLGVVHHIWNLVKCRGNVKPPVEVIHDNVISKV